MPLTISRIGQARGRPVVLGFGRCGAITRHSASVRSVWYRVTGRLCCCRVVGVHMANPRLVGETPWNHGGSPSFNPFQKLPLTRARGLNLDIDGWLRWIGLDQYAEMFRTNDIDFELLGRLTNEDLKDIGVVSFGHRKKLLEAIATKASGLSSLPCERPLSPLQPRPARNRE